jgi:Protein of unknown function (DUF2946)
MRLSRVHRRFTAWLAMLAMVLGALAPTVAQAVVVSSDRAGWVEVCSVSGMTWVQVDADTASSDNPSSPGADSAMHCPWCTLHGGAADLPPESSRVEPLQRPTEPPPAFSRAVTLSGTWADAHARAPPLAI